VCGIISFYFLLGGSVCMVECTYDTTPLYHGFPKFLQEYALLVLLSKPQHLLLPT
jgi:hypothetical protein